MAVLWRKLESAARTREQSRVQINDRPFRASGGDRIRLMNYHLKNPRFVGGF